MSTLRCKLLSLVFLFLSSLHSSNSIAQICDCKEYIYLNEVTTGNPAGAGSIHKFEVQPNGDLDEIGMPWFSNAAAGETVTSPHGLGSDLNGFLYIGEATEGNIRKFDCDGNIFPSSEFSLDGTGQFNIVSVDNYLFNNPGNREIVQYDLCNLAAGGIARVRLNMDNGGRDWGLYRDPRTGTFYATTNFGEGTADNAVFQFTFDDFEVNPSTQIQPLPLDANFPVENASIRGITTDADENIYIVVQKDLNLTDDPAYLLKYGPAPDYNYLGTSDFDTDDFDNVGWSKAVGIVYSETNNLLYISTESQRDDCVSLFNTNLDYLGTAVPAPPITGVNAKGIAIQKECCPSPLTQTINQTYCADSVNQVLFLNEIFPCDGIVCGAEWTPDPGNTGISYDPCDQSITVTGTEACAIFTKVGSNNQCGAFNLTYNLDVLTTPEVSVTGGGTICPDNPSVDLTASTSTSGVTYQWQSSTTGCDGTWSDIGGATSATYTVSGITADTDYRVLTTLIGTCSSGVCVDTTACVMVEYATECSVCECIDYLYVNDVDINGVHKFEIDLTTGGLTEILNNGGIWLSGIARPHGASFDLNGFLYIAEKQGTSNDVWKVTCDGDVIDDTIFNGDFDGSNYNNFVTIGNLLYVNGASQDDVKVYDLCEEQLIGRLDYAPFAGAAGDNNWELMMGQDGNVYTIDSQNDTLKIYQVPTDPSLYTIPTTTVIEPYLVTDLVVQGNSDFQYWGLEQDENGYWYVINSNGGSGNEKIFVIDPMGVTQDTISDIPGIQGFTGGRGFEYLPATKTLYIASEIDDCVAVYTVDAQSSTYTYQSSLSIPGGGGKDLSLSKECCPNPLTQTIDQTYCADSINQVLFLNELFPCDGVVCGAEWMPDPSNTGITFDPCDQSITITAAEACATFTKVGSNNQCAAFNLTYNLDVLTTPEVTISGTSPTCATNNDPAPISVNVTGGGNSTYTWQSSTTDCDNGWTTIAGAPTDGTAYDPPVINQETHYRLIAEANGNCSSGTCRDTSNCVTLTPDAGCIITCTPPAAPALSVQNNICPATTGSFTVTTPCNSGSTIEYSTDNGSNWTSTMPAWTDGLTLIARCADDGDATCFSPNSNSVSASEQTCLSFYSLGNRVFFDDDINGTQNGTEAGIDGVQLQLLNADGSVYDSDPASAGIQALIVTTANGGYYRFDDLPEGNYIVEVLPTAFATNAPLENYSSSDGALQEMNPNTDGDLNDNGLDTPDVSGSIRSGIISLGGTEPLGEAEPGTYAAGSATGTAAADAESNLTVDFGFYRQRDRPDFENPNLFSCGDEPCHFLSADIYLGTGVTNDNGSVGSSSADGDIDDGVAVSPEFNAAPGNTIYFPVSVYNNTGSDAFIRAWIDWNADGDFEDPGEQVYNVTNSSIAAYTIVVPVTVPSEASIDLDLAMRWRISTDDNNSAGPCGTGNCAADGEIEDYLLHFSCPTPLCVPITTTVRD